MLLRLLLFPAQLAVCRNCDAYVDPIVHFKMHPEVMAILDRVCVRFPPLVRPGWDLPEAIWHEYLKGCSVREYADEVVLCDARGWPANATDEWECYGERNVHPPRILS